MNRDVPIMDGMAQVRLVAKGVKLSTDAEYKIRGAILDSLRNADWAPRLQRKRASVCPKMELGISTEEYRDWTGSISSLTISSPDSVASQEDGRNSRSC